MQASPTLRSFVEEIPLERASIAEFVQATARVQPAGTKVLDAGAGNAPYRELFDHCEYTTADWPNSVHEGARQVDIQASLDALPVTDDTYDLVLCTQVLEHVADPVAVLSELHRVLRPGGALALTAPLAWPLHEAPHDYYRYTSFGLTSLLERAGFTDIAVSPRNGPFATVSQLAAMLGRFRAQSGPRRSRIDRARTAALGRAAAMAARVLAVLGPHLAPFEARDADTFPLGYSARARKR